MQEYIGASLKVQQMHANYYLLGCNHGCKLAHTHKCTHAQGHTIIFCATDDSLTVAANTHCTHTHQIAIKKTHTQSYTTHSSPGTSSYSHRDTDTHTRPPLCPLQTVMMACVWEVNGCLLLTTFTLDYSSRVVSGQRGHNSVTPKPPLPPLSYANHAY